VLCCLCCAVCAELDCLDSLCSCTARDKSPSPHQMYTRMYHNAQDRVLSFGNVELLGAKDGEDKNAAEMAVARG